MEESDQIHTLVIYCEDVTQANAWLNFLNTKLPYNEYKSVEIRDTVPIFSPGFTKTLDIKTSKKKVDVLTKHIALKAFNAHNEAWSGEKSPWDKSTSFKPRGYVNGSFRYLTLYLEEQARGKTSLLGRTSPISPWW